MKKRIKVLHRGMLVELKDEVGFYILLDYDRLNKKWGFREFCICEHSCHSGYTDKKNIAEITQTKKEKAND